MINKECLWKETLGNIPVEKKDMVFLVFIKK